MPNLPNLLPGFAYDGSPAKQLELARALNGQPSPLGYLMEASAAALPNEPLILINKMRLGELARAGGFANPGQRGLIWYGLARGTTGIPGRHKLGYLPVEAYDVEGQLVPRPELTPDPLLTPEPRRVASFNAWSLGRYVLRIDAMVAQRGWRAEPLHRQTPPRFGEQAFRCLRAVSGLAIAEGVLAQRR